MFSRLARFARAGALCSQARALAFRSLWQRPGFAGSRPPDDLRQPAALAWSVAAVLGLGLRMTHGIGGSSGTLSRSCK
jgi:hypothetical protein